MKKWTRAEIEKNFLDNLSDVYTGNWKNIYKGSPMSSEIYRSQCIHYLEIINQLLIENNLQDKVDFENIVKASVWSKKTENPETATMLGFLSVHKCYLSYLESLYESILRGNISDDYKFQELDTEGEYTYREAAEYCQCKLSKIEKAVKARKLEKVIKDGKPKKGGKCKKENLLWGWSINDFKKNKK